MIKMNNKKILGLGITTFIFILLFLSFTEASPGIYKQGKSINLLQTCANCSYINITSIIAPDGTQIIGNVPMTKSGAVYNYTLDGSLIYQIGTYKVHGIGDEDGIDEVWVYSFEVKGGNDTFFIILLILFYGLTFYGISIKNEWVSLIGCLGLLPLGVYLSFNGIGLYKNTMTDVVSYITIGVGLGIGFESLRNIMY